MDERRKLIELLDRLEAVDRTAVRKFLPDMIVDQWLHGDAEARQTIEDRIDLLPKRRKQS